MTDTASPALLRHRLDWVLWVLVTIYIAIFAVVFSRCLILVQFGDTILWQEQYASYTRDGGFLQYLFLPYNGHRLALVRLLTMIDVELLGGRELAFTATGLASLIGIFILVWKEIARSGEPAFGPATVLSAAIVFTVPNAVVCDLPNYANYAVAVFFVLLSIVSVAAKDYLRPRMLGLAITAAICGTLTNAICLLVWPALLWFAWQARAGWHWLIAICVVGLLFGCLFIADRHQASHEAAASIGEALRYWPSFVGLPWTRSHPLEPVARFVGIGLSSAAVVFASLRIYRPDRLETLAITFVVFSLGASVFAAIGRAGPHGAFIPVRYTIFLTPLHLALLFFVQRQGWLSEKIALAVLALFSVQQLFAGFAAIRVASTFGIPLGF